LVELPELGRVLFEFSYRLRESIANQYEFVIRWHCSSLSVSGRLSPIAFSKGVGKSH
jgi:hypothetical protein